MRVRAHACMRVCACTYMRHVEIPTISAEDLHQKKMKRVVIAVVNARRKRQINPIRGRVDSRQTTWSMLVTGSEGSLPFNLMGRGRKVITVEDRFQMQAVNRRGRT